MLLSSQLSKAVARRLKQSLVVVILAQAFHITHQYFFKVCRKRDKRRKKSPTEFSADRHQWLRRSCKTDDTHVTRKLCRWQTPSWFPISQVGVLFAYFDYLLESLILGSRLVNLEDLSSKIASSKPAVFSLFVLFLLALFRLYSVFFFFWRRRTYST